MTALSRGDRKPMIETGFKSNKGIKRKNNEDACFVLPEEQVYVIADGVGGNNAGELASRAAVSSVVKYVKEKPIAKADSDKALNKYFKKCIDRANKKIIEMASQEPEREGMATTLVVCHIRGSKAYFVNVGDSRAYINRQGKIFQVTEDHTYINSLLKLGVITPEEAKDHKQGHMITRALGAEDETEADFYETDIEDNDVIVLCTDGLYGEMDDERISRLISENEKMTDLANKMIIEANRLGGNDNITVVCLKYVKGGKDE